MSKNNSSLTSSLPAKRKTNSGPFLQALSIAVNYADILQWTCANMRHFDDWLVVTAESDFETKELCKRHGIRTIDSKTIHAGGAKFAKAAALNEGLSHMRPDEWVIVMDADILLPEDFRERIAMELLQKSHLYGLAGRKICEDFDEFKLFRCHQEWQRLATSDIVLGYFQLFWNDGVITFPEVSTDASHYDMVFAEHFGVDRQRFLPFGCLHLGPVHTNWKGRKAAPFCQIGDSEIPQLKPAAAVSALLRAFRTARHLSVVQWGTASPSVTRALLQCFAQVVVIDAEGIFAAQPDPLLERDLHKRRRDFELEFSDVLGGRLMIVGPATEDTFAKVRSMQICGWLICGEPTATIFERIGVIVRSGMSVCRFVMGLHFSLLHNRASSAVVNLVFGSPKHIDPTGVWLTSVSSLSSDGRADASSRTRKKQSVGIHYVLTRNEEVIDLLSSLLHLRKIWKGAVQVTCAVAFPVGFRQVLKDLHVDFETSELASQDPVELWAHCIGLSRFDVTMTLEVGCYLRSEPPPIEKLLGRADVAVVSSPSTSRTVEGYIELAKRCKLDTSRLASLWPSRSFGASAVVWKRQNRSFIGGTWWESLSDMAARLRRGGGRISRDALLSIALAPEQNVGELDHGRWLGKLPDNDPKAEYWLSKMAPSIRVHQSRAIVTVLVPENQHLFRAAAARWRFLPKSHLYVITTSGVDVDSLRAAHPGKHLHWIGVEPGLEDPAARAELALFLGIRRAKLESDWCYVNAALLPSIASELFSEEKWKAYDLIGYCWYHDANRSNRRSVSLMGGFGCVSARLTKSLSSMPVSTASFESALNTACASLRGRRTTVSIRDMGWFDELDVDQFAKNWQDLG